MEEILINWIRKNPAFAEDSDDSYHNRKQMMEFAKHYHKKQLLLHDVSVPKGTLLFHLKALTKQIEDSHCYGFEDVLEDYIKSNAL